MVLRRAHVELGVLRIAVSLIGLRRLPFILAEMWLGKRDEHPLVVRSPQNLGKTQMRARLTPVVVRVNEVDAEAFEPLHALFRCVVCRPRCPKLGVVKRDGTKENPGSV